MLFVSVDASPLNNIFFSFQMGTLGSIKGVYFNGGPAHNKICNMAQSLIESN